MYLFIYLFNLFSYFIIIIYLCLFSGGYITFCCTLHTLSSEGDNMCSHHRAPDVLCHTVTMLPQSYLKVWYMASA